MTTNPTDLAGSPDASSPAPDRSDLPAWDRWFAMTERGSTLGREVRGGLVTFVTMAYIVVLNPLIIGTAQDINGQYIGGGDNPVVAIGLVSAATALIAGVMTLVMGGLGRFPLAVAAGLGLNSFLAYTIAPLMTWPQAMGLIVLEGLIIGLLVLSRVPDRSVQRGPDAVEVRDRCGDRAVHRADRPGRRRHHPPGRPADLLRRQWRAARLADPGVRASACC